MCQVELSTVLQGIAIHVLGLNIRPDSDAMREAAAVQAKIRSERAELIAARLEKLGIEGALSGTRKLAGKGWFGRPHFAQFLVETGSLSAVGGFLGIALGVGLSVALGHALPWLLELRWIRGFVQTEVNLETNVTAWSIMVSFTVATAIGLVFGIYPAVVASRQDPIVALRHD